MNGDGKLDLVVADGIGATVSVLMNSGMGTFGAKVDYVVADGVPTGFAPRSVALGDVNGDGRPDIAVANYDSNTLSVLVNSGTGTFAPKVDYATESPSSVAVGDMDGDGKVDLVVANQGSATASVLVNSGTGTFATPVYYPTGRGPLAGAVGDVDGDGKLDLVVSNVSTPL